MPITPFQLVEDQTFVDAGVVDGKVFISPDQKNGIGGDLSTGVRITVAYHDLQVSGSGVSLQAIVETKSEQGRYSVIAYQFEEFAIIGFEQERQIVMSPDLNWPDAGIDNAIFIGGQTTAQVSNQTGILPETWRLSVNLKDPNDRFISIRMSIFGERYNPITFPDAFKGVVTDGEGKLVTLD